MLVQDVIRPSSSPYNSPLVIVQKSNGKYRLCVDYRKLNEITVKDAYQLPHISDIFDVLGGAKWFSTLDLASGYWQLEIDEHDKQKTSFSFPGRNTYEFNVMPFGLCNAPATFQRFMEQVYQQLLWRCCLSFLDDLMVYGGTFCEEIANLGRIISAEGISCCNEKIAAVRDWSTPEDRKDVRAFLGLAGYYRRFIEDFADIAYPPTRLTRAKVPFLWSPE